MLNALTKVGLKRSIKHEMGRRSATKIGGSSDYSMGIHSKNGTKNLMYSIVPFSSCVLIVLFRNRWVTLPW